jgi:hypothetical protein
MAKKKMNADTDPQILPVPDPTVLTTQYLEREISDVQREFALRQETLGRELGLRQEMREREHASLQEFLQSQIASNTALIERSFAALDEVGRVREAHRLEMKAEAEAHRLELKADGEKALSTALTAAEKAVQAALAAAEKARDQQTIASQLATTKAEDAAKEQLKTQGEKFSADIAALVTSVNDTKGLMTEMRAERRGGHDQVQERRASTSQVISVVALFAALLGGVLVAVITKLLGG